MSHDEALAAIGRIVERGGDADQLLRSVVELLQEGLDHYSWLGIYLVEGDELVLGPWRGPEATEHVRIPVGQGICGAAVDDPVDRLESAAVAHRSRSSPSKAPIFSR